MKKEQNLQGYNVKYFANIYSVITVDSKGFEAPSQ